MNHYESHSLLFSSYCFWFFGYFIWSTFPIAVSIRAMTGTKLMAFPIISKRGLTFSGSPQSWNGAAQWMQLLTIIYKGPAFALPVEWPFLSDSIEVFIFLFISLHVQNYLLYTVNNREKELFPQASFDYTQCSHASSPESSLTHPSFGSAQFQLYLHTFV